MGPGAVFAAFLALGCRAFGGPVAHLALFREALVARRGWIGERDYADTVALCQFLPGPTSSQVGMLIGWRLAGWRGLLAAWFGFTLPGAMLMIAAGCWAGSLDAAAAAPALHGVKIAVFAVVAMACTAMWRQLCTDRWRSALALATAAAVLAAPAAWWQIPALAAAGAAGWLLPARPLAEDGDAPARSPGRTAAWLCLALCLAGLALLPLAAGAWAATTGAMFSSGALVFGGGHVVLPLLSGAVVESGRMDAGTFLAGYGLVQAMPGPLFNIAGYLGAALHGPGAAGVLGGALAVVAIFLPGALLAVAALPAWSALRRHAGARRIADGLCAGVVGLLAAALWDPVASSAILGMRDAAWACAALAALVAGLPSWALVALCAALGAFSG
jgi:chromate transporter